MKSKWERERDREWAKGNYTSFEVKCLPVINVYSALYFAVWSGFFRCLFFPAILFGSSKFEKGYHEIVLSLPLQLYPLLLRFVCCASRQPYLFYGHKYFSPRKAVDLFSANITAYNKVIRLFILLFLKWNAGTDYSWIIVKEKY